LSKKITKNGLDLSLFLLYNKYDEKAIAFLAKNYNKKESRNV